MSELPNPIEAQKFRLPYLLQLNSKKEQLGEKVLKGLATCSQDEDAPLIVFVSKMLTVPRKQINERGLGHSIEEESLILGFARVFSGCLKRNQEVLVIGAKPKKV